MYVRACAISPGQGCAPPGLQHDQEAAKEGALRQARHLQAVGGRDHRLQQRAALQPGQSVERAPLKIASASRM